MKPEIKKRWLEALRSGKYTQARGYMKQDGSHCCLGVLSDLYAKEQGILITDLYHNGAGGIGATACVHDAVTKWAGLKDEGALSQFASMNDNGSSFEEIAAVIETTVKTEELVNA